MILVSIIYILCTVLLLSYGMATLLLLGLYLVHRVRGAHPPAPEPANWPSVMVQLPVYNEAHVVHRLIDAAAALDYPRDRLSIQVLDDSTDHTVSLVQARVAAYQAAGINITQVRRPVRNGYKAGALAYGLTHTDADLVAMFDADFLPTADFLRQIVPTLMTDPRIGAVQARWGHLNAGTNLLTRAQALSIDMHFVVEQPTRDRAGLLLNFSGSAGVWRRACIEDAGGWHDTTLTEDLDLSYRAQLRGWRFAVLPHIEVPAELPPQMAAYKRQQARWTKGGTQCLRIHGPSILRAKMGRFKKLMALVHLGQRLSHPLLLLMMILTVPLMLDGMLEHLTLGVLGLLGFAPIVAFAISQYALYPRWPLRLLILPVLTILGAGVTVNNTLAIIAALLGRSNVFERTPKFGAAQWQASRYALLADKTVIGELALALYAGLGAVLAIAHNKPATLPLFATYALSCGGMALLTLLESRRVVRTPHHKRERGRQPDSSQMA